MSETEMKFASTATYVADDSLQVAVNAAVALQRPLLVKGDETSRLYSCISLQRTPHIASMRAIV